MLIADILFCISPNLFYLLLLVSLSLPLTINDHLEAGSAGPPREIQLTVSQVGTMLDDGCLSCVKLSS